MQLSMVTLISQQYQLFMPHQSLELNTSICTYMYIHCTSISYLVSYTHVLLDDTVERGEQERTNWCNREVKRVDKAHVQEKAHLCEGSLISRPLKRNGNKASAYSAAVAVVTKCVHTSGSTMDQLEHWQCTLYSYTCSKHPQDWKGIQYICIIHVHTFLCPRTLQTGPIRRGEEYAVGLGDNISCLCHTSP